MGGRAHIDVLSRSICNLLSNSRPVTSRAVVYLLFMVAGSASRFRSCR